MGGMSLWHLLLIGFIVLIVFGPGRLPNVGRSLGEAIRGFKKGLEGTNDEIDVTNSNPDKLKQGQDGQVHSQAQTQKQKQDS